MPADPSQVAGQTYLADRDGGGGQREVGVRRCDGQRHGQIRRRIGQPHSADRRQVDVTRPDPQVGPLLQHRRDHRRARRVDAADRAARRRRGRNGYQGLHLADERTLAVERHGDRGARNRRWPLIEEKPRRVRNAVNPVVVQHETADLVGRAEPVLDPAHHAKRRRLVAFEMQYDVDEMLQRSRPCDRAVLGHMADQDDRDARAFSRSWSVPSSPPAPASHRRSHRRPRSSTWSAPNRPPPTSAGPPRYGRERSADPTPRPGRRRRGCSRCVRRASGSGPRIPRRTDTAPGALLRPSDERPRATASTCRHQDRRPAASPSRARCRRPARGRVR